MTFWFSVSVTYDFLALNTSAKFHLQPFVTDEYFNKFSADSYQSLSAHGGTKVHPFYAKKRFFENCHLRSCGSHGTMFQYRPEKVISIEF